MSNFAVNPTVLRFEMLADLDFSRSGNSNKFCITDKYSKSISLQSVDDPLYHDLKELLYEADELDVSHKIYDEENENNGKPLAIPDLKITEVQQALDYFCLTYVNIETRL
jgi:hypothetical protein